MKKLIVFLLTYLSDVLYEIRGFVRMFWHVLLLYFIACLAFACLSPYLFKKIDQGLQKVQTLKCPCKN
jgi:hypothetical protein